MRPEPGEYGWLGYEAEERLEAYEHDHRRGWRFAPHRTETSAFDARSADEAAMADFYARGED